MIVGAASEREQCREVLECDPAGRIVDLVGRTSIGELMALVERASLVVGSDSACLHMAVGFDRPLVGLYGPTDVARVGPYQRERWVIQKLAPDDVLDHKNDQAGASLMARITVDDVFQRIREALADSAAATPTRAGRT